MEISFGVARTTDSVFLTLFSSFTLAGDSYAGDSGPGIFPGSETDKGADRAINELDLEHL